MYPSLLIRDIISATQDEVPPELDDGGEATFTYSVRGHKTARSGHVVCFTVAKSLHEDMINYCFAIKQQRELTNEDKVIRKRNLTPANEENITKMAQAAWKNAGMERSFNFTTFRKQTTFVARKHHPNSREAIADKGGHHVRTADMHYHIKGKTQQNVNTHRKLRESFKKEVEHEKECEPGK